MVSRPIQKVPSRTDTAADKTVEQPKAQAVQEELEKARLENEELKNGLQFKYLGVLQSGDADSLCPVNHREEIAWSRYITFRCMLTSPLGGILETYKSFAAEIICSGN